MKLSTIIRINNDTNNPIAVGVTIEGFHDYPSGWEWSIVSIDSVELVISDKEGIDITGKVLNNARAKALITAQIANEDDQVINALTEGEDENEQIDLLKTA